MVLGSLIYDCPPEWVSPAEKLMKEKGEIRPVTDLEGSEICRFFQGKKVLVTGATGFLGKLLVEKLLRTCDLDTIYVLVREKQGVEVTDRINSIYEQEVFGPLRKLRPDFQRKIRPIKGDISLPDLGLDPSDEALLRTQVNVIFHGAATVKFDEKLSLATPINVRGTRDLLRLAARCENLVSFVHISTAYANCNLPEVEERIYEPPIGADDLIDWVCRKSDEEVLAGTAAMLRDWPNTYTFTKAVAEGAVRTYGRGLPICVYRPAAVVPTYREPLRGWTDNVYGVTAVVVSSELGFLRTWYLKQKYRAEVVPGDLVTNGLIAAAYVTGKERHSTIPVYNFGSSHTNCQAWLEYSKVARKYAQHNPPIRSVWIYCLSVNEYKFIHQVKILFFEILPNLLMDLGILITGGTPVLTKMHRKVTKMRNVIEPFCNDEWNFHTRNTQELWKKMSEKDKEVFPFDMSSVDWDEFHVTHAYGLRRCILKEDPSTIAAARQKWRRLSIWHIIIKTLFYVGISAGLLWMWSKL